MKDQIKMRDFCWITCILVHFSEMHCAFHWNLLRISLKCAVHFTAHFTAHFSVIRCAFHWNPLRISVKCASTWNAQRISVKCAADFTEMRSAFQQYLMSFWVPTKYRSFLRKTKQFTKSVTSMIYGRTIIQALMKSWRTTTNSSVDILFPMVTTNVALEITRCRCYLMGLQ